MERPFQCLGLSNRAINKGSTYNTGCFGLSFRIISFFQDGVHVDLILDQAPAPPTLRSLRSLRSLRLSSPSNSRQFVKFVSKSWFFNGVQRHAGSAFFAVKQPL